MEEDAHPEPAVFLSNVTDQDDVLRGCAALRVRCFYSYDPERCGDGAVLFGEAADRARRRWLDKRARAEEERMHKMEQLGMRVTSFAATCRAPPREVVAAEAKAAEAAESARWRLDGDRGGGGGGAADTPTPPVRCVVPRVISFSSAALSSPSSPSSPLHHAGDEEVVGTLDFHVGARLPGELLEGTLPASDEGDKLDSGGNDDDVLSGGKKFGGVGDVHVSVATVATFAAVADPGGVTAVGAALAHGVSGLDPPAAAAAAAVGGVLPVAGGVDGESDGGGYAGGGAMGGRRAYIFNVCVASHRRRQGIAARLLRLAHFTAAEAGVEYLYVHVEKGNEAARELYEAEGYVQESEESEWLASKLGRPARSLLVLDLKKNKMKKMKK